MEQKRHGLFSVMMRSSPNGKKHGPHASNPLSVNKTGYDETANPCGCKPEQDNRTPGLRPGLAPSRMPLKQKEAYSSHSFFSPGYFRLVQYTIYAH